MPVARSSSTKPLYLVAVDGSRPSKLALEAAITLAKEGDARLEVVTVEDVSSMAHKTRLTAEVPRVARLVREAADYIVGRARQEASKQGVETQGAVLEGAHPAHAIVKRAEKDDADMIVVGSRGRTGIKRMVLGSVAESVVRHAPCTVVVVR